MEILFNGNTYSAYSAGELAKVLNRNNTELYYSAEPIYDFGYYGIAIYDDDNLIGYYR